MTPKLRFPGFTDTWQTVRLGNIFTFKNGLNADKSKYGKGIKYISVSDILDNRYITFENIKSSVQVTDEELIKNVVKPGDVLFQRSSETREEVGQANIYIGDRDVIFGGFVIRGRPKIEYNPFFFNALLKASSVRKSITDRSGGSTRYNIGQDSLDAVIVHIPSMDEQQKIAESLNSVDDKIFALEQKVERLETYKRGVMQKIFARHIRFTRPDGSSYPEWKIVKLGSVLVEVDVRSKANNEYPAISSTSRGVFLQQDYFNKDIASRDNVGYKLLRKNQVVVSPQNLWMGNINYNDKFDIGIVSPSYKIFDIAKQHEPTYVQQILKTPRMMFEYMQASEQGASIVRRNLDINSFNAIKVSMPSYEEQQKIADSLSAIDQKITLTTQQLEKTKEFKKGLLQRMFV